MAKERYTLEKKLGEGGMGEVWLAKDTLLNRPVAVKFLQATEETIYKDLFLSEARTLASLRHPNITLIYDAVFEEADNRFYIMMEYVKGKSLEELIEEADGPLPLDTIIAITIEILNALDYAHKLNIVHRDVKPANIVIQDNELKLTDFGLATLISLLSETKEPYLLGTPAYMPPEQIAGEGIDGRADLYALGVTLFEMVTGGKRPFNNSNRRELLMAHIEHPPPSVREFEPSTPLMIDGIISKLLAKHPDDRYPSAGVVHNLFKSMQARQKFNQRYMQLLDPEAKPLLGRDHELKALQELWAETQAKNKARLVVVSGEMGIGKSRLIAEFLGESVVDQGMVAVAGRCDELGAPYTPYTQILATIFDRGLIKPAAIKSKIDIILNQIPSLAPLLNIDSPPPAQEKPPALRDGLWKTLSDRLPAQGLENPLKAQWQFFSIVTNLFMELGPTVLFLDDAAYLDESSLALTRFLIRQVQLPLLIMAEYKASNKAESWLDDFAADEKQTIALKPLPAALTRQYLTNFLGAPVSEAVVNMVEKRARSNPFYLEEAMRQLIDAGDFYQAENREWRYKPPDDFRSSSQEVASPFLINAFTRRLDKISGKSRELLALAALIESGPEFNFDIWLTLLGGESRRPEAQEALNEALERRLIRDMGQGAYTFRPPDVATALCDTLPEDRRREIHQQIAEILLEEQRNPLLIGYHFEQAGQATKSAHYLEEAGARAVRANATSQAIDCYKRALELVESRSSYAALGNLYRQRGEWEASIDALKRSLTLAQQTNELESEAQLLNELAFTSWLSDNYQQAADYASAALRRQNISSIERATAQSHLGMISWCLGHFREAEAWCQKSVEILEKSRAKSRLAGAYNRLGLVYFAKGKFAEATETTQRSLTIRREAGDHWGEGYCLVNLGQIAADQGRFEEAEAHFKSALALFEKIDSSDGLMVTHTERGRALLLQIKPADAMPLLSRALSLAEAINKRSAYGLGDIHIQLGQAHLALGNIDQAQKAVVDGLSLVKSAGNRKYIAVGQAILAQIYAAQDRRDMAEVIFKRTIELFEQIDHPSGRLRTQLKYANFLQDQAKEQAAAAIKQQARQEAVKIGLFLE